MHALDWLNELGRILRGAIQPIERVLFASFSLQLQPQAESKAEPWIRKEPNDYVNNDTECKITDLSQSLASVEVRRDLLKRIDQTQQLVFRVPGKVKCIEGVNFILH